MLGTALVRRSALTALASFVLYAGACSSGSEPSEPEPQNNPELEGVVYLGDTNDEGLVVLLDAELGAGDAPIITAPEEGAVLEAKTTFTYQYGVSAARGVRPAARPRGFSFGELFGPERVAHAHGAPMNGAAFLLTFSTTDSPNLLRVFTDDTSYEPDDDDWAILVAAGEVTLTIRAGVFEEGRLPGGGPVDSDPRRFVVSSP